MEPVGRTPSRTGPQITSNEQRKPYDNDKTNTGQPSLPSPAGSYHLLTILGGIGPFSGDIWHYRLVYLADEPGGSPTDLDSTTGSARAGAESIPSASCAAVDASAVSRDSRRLGCHLDAATVAVVLQVTPKVASASACSRGIVSSCSFPRSVMVAVCFTFSDGVLDGGQGRAAQGERNSCC